MERAGSRYSRAVMETLTLIAYRQPIARAEIETIRGVAVSSQIVQHPQGAWLGAQHRPQGGGGSPELLATTREFLDYFNLQESGAAPRAGSELQAPCRSCRARGGDSQPLAGRA